MNTKDSRRESSATSTPLENYDTKEIAASSSSSSSSQYEEKDNSTVDVKWTGWDLNPRFLHCQTLFVRGYLWKDKSMLFKPPGPLYF